LEFSGYSVISKSNWRKCSAAILIVLGERKESNDKSKILSANVRAFIDWLVELFVREKRFIY